MTRVTAPMSQLARSLTTNTSVARPSLASRVSKAAASLSHSEFGLDGRSSDNEASRRGITTAHRPVTVQPNPGRTIPLMQGFHSSAAPAARVEAPLLGFTVLPMLHAEAAAAREAAANIVRVPLMPDNFSPDRSSFPSEAPDAPLPAAQISVVAAHPENVLSALTEVEGIGLDGVELKFVHEPSPPAAAAAAASPSGQGMIKDVWYGMIDDVLGKTKSTIV